MASNPPGRCCTIGTLFKGTPKGKIIKIDNKIEAYVAAPAEGKNKTGQGILYVPDILGIWQNSKLMADLFADYGYTTLIPDLFNGDSIGPSRPENFDVRKWLAEGSDGNNPHDAPHIDPIVEAGIKYMRGLGLMKLGVVGYCLGAKKKKKKKKKKKYAVRHFKDGIDVGFIAHPSFVEEDELAAITGPLSIAAAETDHIFSVDQRHRTEEILRTIKLPYQINLFSGVAHGFAIRGDLEVKTQRFAKEQAFLQAVAWFENYLS